MAVEVGEGRERSLGDDRVVVLDEGPPPTVVHHRRDEGLVRQRLRGLKVTWLAGDLLFLGLAFVAVSLLQYGADWEATWDRLLPTWRGWIPAYGVGMVALWRQLGMYRINPGWTAREEMRRSFTSGLYLLALTTSLLFVLNLDQVSRLLVFTVAELLVVWSALTRVAGRQWLANRRLAGHGTVNVLIVGTGRGAVAFMGELDAMTEAGMTGVGYLGPDAEPVPGLQRLGDIDDLAQVLTDHVIDEVVICLSFDRWVTINQVVQVAEDQGKSVHLPVWGLGNIRSPGRLQALAGMPVLSLTPKPEHEGYRWAKRAMDVTGALVGLTMLSPVLLAAGLAIWAQDRGPALYRQERIGMHGRRFRIVKFRTMVMNADQMLTAEMAELHAQGVAFKDEDDPRITRLGRLLRRTSIDELPQLWNVLKGDMSLVGPRPMVQSEVDNFTTTHRRRLSVKPGITGLWQVEARNATDFEQRFAQDLRYIDDFSLAQDVRILAKTVSAVVRMTGS